MILNRIYVAVWLGGEYKPSGIVYFNKENGVGGFQYLNTYNGPTLDPVHLNYKADGTRNFPIKRSTHPELLHRVFQNFVPSKWALNVLIADYPEFKKMCGAERLYALGSRTVGGLSTRVIHVDNNGDPSPVKLKDEDPFKASRIKIGDTDCGLDRLLDVKLKALRFFSKKSPFIDEPAAKWGLTSHGGARPKLTITDEDGRHWMVKFNLDIDGLNAGRMENAISLLAKNTDIEIPETKVLKINESCEVFAIERYDRSADNRSFQASMFSLMDETKIKAINEGDYQDMFEVLDKASAQPGKDKIELFRRMLFNVAVNNTDDHLENFSMILGDDGWKLSPAYDLTLDVSSNKHTTSIFGKSELDISDRELILNLANKVGIDRMVANQVYEKVVQETAKWKQVFEDNGVAQEDINKANAAFQVKESLGNRNRARI